MFVRNKKITCRALLTTFELKVQIKKVLMLEDTHGINLTSKIFL